MSRPRLIDLYCCAGGAGAGYAAAGFDVVGVDINPQPHYPFEFVQADVLELISSDDWHRGFDAVHASPPCQMFSAYRRARPDRGDEHYVNLIPQTRAALLASGKPFIMENVPGAPLVDPVVLCGSMFDRPIRRHRLFESNVPLVAPGPCRHPGPEAAIYKRGHKGRPNLRRTIAIGEWRIPLDMQQDAMQIDWMTVAELSQAIPPAYTKWLGAQLMEHVRVPA